MFQTVDGKIGFDLEEHIMLLKEALRTLIFNKKMRMNSATSKDFTDGEANIAIHGWTMQIIEFCHVQIMNFNAPLVLIGACYMTFIYIGYYALIVVFLTLL